MPRLSILFLGALLLCALILTIQFALGSPPLALSSNEADSFVAQTPFFTLDTLTPTQTATSLSTSTPDPTETPEPTETPDGPPVSLEGYERLFPGVFYKREMNGSPRPYVAHIVIVDLNRQNIDLMVTPPEELGHTTSHFLKRYGLQMAINGDGWLGEMNPIGFAASEGEVYSEAAGTPTIYVTKNGKVKVGGNPPEKQIWYAISGSNLLVKRGQIIEGIRNCEQQAAYCEELQPRTSVGISANNYLIIVLVEGPPSEPRAGLTVEELAQLHVELGSEDAIAMDGGGSSTLVVDTGDGPHILNNPSDGSERQVANHLGIFVRNRDE